jgi:hypothetical protein
MIPSPTQFGPSFSRGGVDPKTRLHHAKQLKLERYWGGDFSGGIREFGLTKYRRSSHFSV